MKCHYCGKEVWLVRHLLDGDFCSPSHRKKYHERLRRSFSQLPEAQDAPAPIAGFHLNITPSNAFLDDRSQSGFGMMRTGPDTRMPQTRLALSPLFGETFLAVVQAEAAGPGRVQYSAVLQPELAAAPPAALMTHAWTLVQDAEPDAGAAAPANVLQPEVGAPALPLRTPPVALPVPLAAPDRPPLAVANLPFDRSLGETALPPALAIESNGNHAAAKKSIGPLLSWMSAGPAVADGAARVRKDPVALLPAPAAPVENRGFALQPAAGSLPGFPFALLAEDTVAQPAVRNTQSGAMPVELRPAATQLPAMPASIAARPPRDDEAIWKIHPAVPFGAAPMAPVLVAFAASRTSLPEMAVVPRRATLAASADVRSLDAMPREIAVFATRTAQPVDGLAAQHAWMPKLPPPGAQFALPEAAEPRLSRVSLVPREAVAAPSSGADVASSFAEANAPQAAVLARGMETLPAREPRLRLSAPLAAAISASAPQDARVQCALELESGSQPQAGWTAVPERKPLGFSWSTFASLAPDAADRTARPLAPVPAPISNGALWIGAASIGITGTEVPGVADAIPLDVYLQRLRSAPKRDCQAEPLEAGVLAPPVSVDLWPARFEQLVLQDWRRRYPTRKALAAQEPEPIGGRVIAMPKPRAWLERVRREAPQYVKALAACLVLGAGLWFSWSTHSVRSMIATNRQWLSQAIARRATMEIGDNFHSGLNLWDGRQNWQHSWSYDKEGFMRTGQLALYRPSQKLTDYRLEFFAQIEKKSVGWVFRAKDEQNYYAMKLSITEPGPRPLVSVVRYPVVEGRKGKHVQIPLPIMMHNNMPYHVALDVRGTHFRAFVEDQEVDSWSDDRIRRGGVGFFSEAGEHARLYWVKVSNNTDWLGRLCGMISGGGTSDEADLGNPAVDGRTMAAIDWETALDGAKNADKRRAPPRAPIVALWMASAL